MICDKYDAQRFIDSEDGKVLHRARVQRDLLAREVDLMADSTRAKEWVQDMIEDYSESAFGQLLNHFRGNHKWRMCMVTEAFRLLCRHVARLERSAAGLPIEYPLTYK